MTYFKVFNADDNHYDFQYKDGLNTDTVPFNPNVNEPDDAGGLYFADKDNVIGFLDYGKFIREVTVPKGAKQVNLGTYYRAESLFLHPKRDLSDVSTWEWLVSLGVDITSVNNDAVYVASYNGWLEVVKYLVAHGADVTANNNWPCVAASRNGHLEVVKFLVERGADVTAVANRAVKLASRNGHLDIVEFLLSKGAKLE